MINVTFLLVLVVISGVAPNKVRRFASTSFDAFTKYPPVPPLPSTAAPEERSTSKEQDTLPPVPSANITKPSADITIEQTIPAEKNLDKVQKESSQQKTIVLEKSEVEPVLPVVTRPAKLRNKPIREQTVTQTDWFDPFTNTPWNNGVEYNTDYISGNAIPHAQNEQNAAISSSLTLTYSSSLITILLIVLWLR